MVIKTNDAAIFTGNIGKEPEEKLVGENQKLIVNVSVAVDKVGENTTWINAYAWGSMLSGLKKGDKVLMAGKRELQTYTGQDGSEKKSEKVKVDFVMVMGKTTQTTQNQPKNNPSEINTFEPIDDSDLPF